MRVDRNSGLTDPFDFFRSRCISRGHLAIISERERHGARRSARLRVVRIACAWCKLGLLHREKSTRVFQSLTREAAREDRRVTLSNTTRFVILNSNLSSSAFQSECSSPAVSDCLVNTRRHSRLALAVALAADCLLFALEPPLIGLIAFA